VCLLRRRLARGGQGGKCFEARARAQHEATAAPSHFWRCHGIVGREKELEAKNSAFVRRVLRGVSGGRAGRETGISRLKGADNLKQKYAGVGRSAKASEGAAHRRTGDGDVEVAHVVLIRRRADAGHCFIEEGGESGLRQTS
jgi:hypothetical protein